jgi:bifunctional non-homologous end joining protein LigD
MRGLMVALNKKSKTKMNRPLAGVASQKRTQRSKFIAKPGFLLPMIAKAVDKLPEGDEWVYEIKRDGYRVQAIKHQENVQLLSRKAKDLTSDFPGVRQAMTTIKAETAVIDGEVVSLDHAGRPSFQNLQHRAKQKGPIVYYAFDLLNLNGEDLTALPLIERKEKLKSILDGSKVLFSENIPGDLEAIVAQVRRLELEGVIAKRQDSRYQPGRSDGWFKLQLKKQQEFIIGGYKPKNRNFGFILVGVYENGKLMFTGKVKAGFGKFSRTKLFQSMRPLEIPTCPFTNLPSARTGNWGEGITADDMKEMKWLKPELVAQIRFTEWTVAGNLRHAAWLGLRDDKQPTEVLREKHT